jgi:hypothetical protein
VRSLAQGTRKFVEEMIAEGFRDVGILVLVFAILDRVITGGITVMWTLTAMAIATFFFGAGLYIERKRPDE